MEKTYTEITGVYVGTATVNKQYTFKFSTIMIRNAGMQ